jgi:GDP-4-dehydro-6-deoxy-D-mannose reductase
MKIVVTGAGGFVGRHLMPLLAADFPMASVLAGDFDVTDAAAVAQFFGTEKPDVCLHLAAVAAIGAAGADPARAWAVNVDGARHVAAAILDRAPGCRMIFISSAEVYGASFKVSAALDESAALAPLNLYAETKAAAEEALAALCAKGLRLLRLRPFNHTGPGQSEAFVAPAFAGQIARIEAGVSPPVIQVGALTPERDFMDVRDVCRAYSLAVRHFDALPEKAVMNIASGRAVRIGEILAMLLAQARCEIAVAAEAARLRSVEIPRAVGDARYAAMALGWRAEIGLEETLDSVLAAARRLVGEQR